MSYGINMKLYVVIPAYNEEKTIGEVILGVKKYTNNIIVVDDGSKDNTYSNARETADDILILRHKINLGKGAASKTGCQAALKLGAEAIALMDADGQHLPEDLMKMMENLKKENLDIVFGVRPINKKMPPLTRLGNKMLTKMINSISGIYLADTQSGLKVFRASAYPKLSWQTSDYSMETEIILRTGRNKLRYSQYYIQTVYRDSYKGMDVFDGIKYFLNFLKQRVSI